MIHSPTLAITMGDPAGVGPEIILKAARRLMPRIAGGKLRLLVIGHRSALAAARAVLGDAPAIPESTEAADWPPLAFLPAGAERGELPWGKISPEGGRFAYLAVAAAVRLALEKRVGAIVTAPLNKAALNLAGHKFAGHTDMLAALTDTKNSVMLLAHGNMRVSHVTTHVALEKVPSLITPERLRKTIDLTVAALHDLGIARPRLAIAALNPHAGEGGLFGTQDTDITAPVIADYAAAGLDITGPVPGDTVFVKLRAGQFDAVVAMYHDQGHIPVKLLGFQIDPATGAWQALSGVNITLGLPIIRTSVDHGTAFDIAGTGRANEESLVEAIEYAERMVAHRKQGQGSALDPPGNSFPGPI
jgi:4-phospho-D-threonate 3-dehydrogenase / 4-phospho-D-erythronate 3-dehydrogenase